MAEKIDFTTFPAPSGPRVIQAGTFSHGSIPGSSGSTTVTVTLNSPQQDTNYYVVALASSGQAFWSFLRARTSSKTTTNFVISITNEGSGASGSGISWSYIVARNS